ncbi:bifunctional 3-(3-hydroxy-phenyl)propionate/3-hydroxycinnamic acid hydroxylase [Nocardia sp. NPDC057455]|uniref:bifunctional 3-(3-hydroxy-phenyl)propionate/3-hydroxycinnamic acid hydroxylase MhpA n=1 Tax=Nocardia sp. NPDC057455 TaxID=3346138 RepID=UPI003671E996
MNVPVVIVGAGPTGLTAALLLARYGVESLVLERWDGIYPQPRAVHLDGEIRRLVARLGIEDEFDAISRPALGLRLLDRDLRVLAEFHRDTAGGRNGYPDANMFDQPELEAILRAAVRRSTGVTLRGDAEVTAVTQESRGARVHFTDRTTGAKESVDARYVLGCDGANSLVRASIGAEMRELDFEQRWLVVDVAITAELGAWEGVHQVCDPVRAATYMRIGTTRYRWEFRLRPGEAAADYDENGRIHELIHPWTGDVPVEDIQLLRVAEYTFRAQLADRWRAGRVFLLGDAAHLTPPFIGQGMGAGLRDAANLTWKLAGVLAGDLPEHVLDSYQIERKPHVRNMIRMAKLTGVAMTEGGELGALLRRLLAPRLRRLPGFHALVTSGETPPLHRSELVARPRLGGGRAGRLVPNAILEDGRRYDDVVGDRYAIVTTIQPTCAEQTRIRERGGVLVTAGRGSELRRWLRRGGARAALVRPDGTVQRCARELPGLCAAMPRFGPRAHEDRAGGSSPSGPASGSAVGWKP